ncbi:enoyl-CoA hydratase/isomerase family protein [Nocardia rhamnosiphila]
MTRRGSQWDATVVGRVGVLAYSNPPFNFLTFAAMAELDDRLAAMGTDDNVHVVLLRSSTPDYFAAHADLADLDRLTTGSLPEAKAFHQGLERIETIPQPVIATIDGQAWGGGLELALACTLRWASERAHFRMLETSLGMIPGAGGTQRLPRLIGPAFAAEMILCGETWTAEHALQVGLVGRVLPHHEFDRRALDTATGMATMPRQALAGAKKALREGAGMALKDALRLEGRICADLLATDTSATLRSSALESYRAASAR